MEIDHEHVYILHIMYRMNWQQVNNHKHGVDTKL
jgi:hypothetical protein